MDEQVEEILTAFPGLRYDQYFAITSPATPDYNCIAWAFDCDNCWMWPEDDVDGVSVWPYNSAGSTDVHTFVEAFRNIGFHECEHDGHEEGFQKIALYCYPDSLECTHAARQLNNGLWTSKLGCSNDIQHSTPFTIQGRLYGKVACILRRSVS